MLDKAESHNDFPDYSFQV